jgi:hypothetical protein
MEIKIKGLEGAGMSYMGLWNARRMQELLDIPESNVCFSVNELLARLKEAQKKENFMFIEG